MKLKTIFSSLAGLFTATTVATAQPAQPAKPLFEDPIVAKAKGGLTVKLSEVEEEFITFKSTLAASGKPIAAEQRDEYMKKILDRVLTTKLVMQRATAEDRAKGDEKLKTFLTESAKRAGSDEAFNRQIEASGINAEAWKAKLRERITVDEVFNREVKSKITIPDEQIRKYYQDNPEKFRQKDTYKVLYLLKLTVDPRSMGAASGPITLTDAQQKAKREELEKLLVRLKGGEDFVALAKEFSEDMGSKDKGGEILFQRGQLLPDLEAEIVKLAPGQMSGIIKTSIGYQIVKLLEVTPEHMVDLAKVRDKVNDFLLSQESDRKAPEYIERIKKEGEVEFLDPKLKP